MRSRRLTYLSLAWVALLVLATPAASAPSIQIGSFSPAVITTGSPASVILTATIPDPAVIPAGVNVVLSDARGRALMVVGALRDDGAGWDSIANDRIFSGVATLAPQPAGLVYLRLSVALRGVLRRVLSNPVAIPVVAMNIPPEPGVAGLSTLEGIDADSDGIRDDIQRYIALTYPDSPLTQLALRDIAQAAFPSVIQSGDNNQSFDNAQRWHRAVECLYYVRPHDAKTAAGELLARILNTRQRSLAYLAFNAQLEGAVFRGVPNSLFKSSCSFDPDAVR